MWDCVCERTRVYTRTHARTPTHAHTHTRTRTHVHAHTQVHTHAHTQGFGRGRNAAALRLLPLRRGPRWMQPARSGGPRAAVLPSAPSVCAWGAGVAAPHQGSQRRAPHSARAHRGHSPTRSVAGFVAETCPAPPHAGHAGAPQLRLQTPGCIEVTRRARREHGRRPVASAPASARPSPAATPQSADSPGIAALRGRALQAWGRRWASSVTTAAPKARGEGTDQHQPGVQG